MMQGLMGNYLEQSKNLFVQMQEQMQKQTENCFPARWCRPSAEGRGSESACADSDGPKDASSASGIESDIHAPRRQSGMTADVASPPLPRRRRRSASSRSAAPRP